MGFTLQREPPVTPHVKYAHTRPRPGCCAREEAVAARDALASAACGSLLLQAGAVRRLTVDGLHSHSRVSAGRGVDRESSLTLQARAWGSAGRLSLSQTSLAAYLRPTSNRASAVMSSEKSVCTRTKLCAQRQIRRRSRAPSRRSNAYSCKRLCTRARLLARTSIRSRAARHIAVPSPRRRLTCSVYDSVDRGHTQQTLPRARLRDSASVATAPSARLPRRAAPVSAAQLSASSCLPAGTPRCATTRCPAPTDLQPK